MKDAALSREEDYVKSLTRKRWLLGDVWRVTNHKAATVSKGTRFFPVAHLWALRHATGQGKGGRLTVLRQDFQQPQSCGSGQAAELSLVGCLKGNVLNQLGPGSFCIGLRPAHEWQCHGHQLPAS